MSSSRGLNVRQLIGIIPDKILSLKSDGYSILVYDVKTQTGKIYDVTEEKQDSGVVVYNIDTDNVIEEINYEGINVPFKKQILENIISTRVDFCKSVSGSVSTSYILGRSSGIHANDNVILLVNHSAKDFSSFIIGSFYNEKSVKYFYIDIICGNPKLKGQASVLLSISIKFITEVMKTKVISLSALDHVISFYPNFGFMFVKDKKNCTIDSAVVEGMSKLNPNIRNGKVVGYQVDDVFQKFLFLLTASGFNSKDDTWCLTASNIGLSDSAEDAIENMTNPVEIDRNGVLVENVLLMEAYNNYINSVNNYNVEKEKSSPNQKILSELGQNIIHNSFAYAKQLYIAGGCSNEGYKMTRCASDSRKRKAESSVSTRSKRTR